MSNLVSETFSGVQIKNIGFPFTVENSSGFIVLRTDTDNRVVYIREKLDVGVLKFNSIDPSSGIIPGTAPPNEIWVHPTLTYTTVKAGVAAALAVAGVGVGNPVKVRIFPTLAGYIEDNPIIVGDGLIIEGENYANGIGTMISPQNAGNLFQDSVGTNLVEYTNLSLFGVGNFGDSAIYASNGSIIVNNCTITDCRICINQDGTGECEVNNCTLTNLTVLQVQGIVSSGNKITIKDVTISDADNIITSAINITGTNVEYLVQDSQVFATGAGAIGNAVTIAGINTTGEIKGCQLSGCTGVAVLYGGSSFDNRITDTIIKDNNVGIADASGSSVGDIIATNVLFTANPTNINVVEGGVYKGSGGIIDTTNIIAASDNFMVAPFEIGGELEGLYVKTNDDPRIVFESNDSILDQNTCIGYDTVERIFKISRGNNIGGADIFKYFINTDNIAIGEGSLPDTISNSNNICLGNSSGRDVTTGNSNICMGVNSGRSITTGSDNMIAGGSAGLNMTGSANIALGPNAIGAGSCSGTNNIAMGDSSLLNIVDATQNIGIGRQTLLNLTTGDSNIAIGNSSGSAITTGVSNTIIGDGSGATITLGSNNIAVGTSVMIGGAVTGINNTSVGSFSSSNLTSGINNLILGGNAGNALTTGNNNIAVGYQSMLTGPCTGVGNIGIGITALPDITSGMRNIALGFETSANLTTGADNICIGATAGSGITTSSNNISIGNDAMSSGIVTGDNNVAIGQSALDDVTTGEENICIGLSAGQSITTANNCVALGDNALNNGVAITGQENIGIGRNAASSVTTGRFNIMLGNSGDSSSNITGDSNIGMGGIMYTALSSGANNTSLGHQSGQLVTTGSENAFLGRQAGRQVTTGSFNVAIGGMAMSGAASVTGDYNVAIGHEAGEALTTGDSNVFIGRRAGWQGAITGNDNLIIGRQSGLAMTSAANNISLGSVNIGDLTTGANNVMLGSGCGVNLTTGSNNIAIGNSAGTAITTVSNNIAIANSGTDTAGRIDIGTVGTHTTCYVQGINGVVTGGAAIPVLIDANGQLGTVSSSRRYKKNISPLSNEKASLLLNLNPVEFVYKERSDDLQYGLIAEEVNEILPDLVHTKDGKIETVYYDKLNAYYIRMLQILYSEIEDLKTEIEHLKK